MLNNVIRALEKLLLPLGILAGGIYLFAVGGYFIFTGWFLCGLWRNWKEWKKDDKLQKLIVITIGGILIAIFYLIPPLVAFACF